MPPPLRIPHRNDLQAMLRLAVPIVTVQVGLMLLGVVDTMVVGHYSAEALAAWNAREERLAKQGRLHHIKKIYEAVGWRDTMSRTLIQPGYKKTEPEE